MDTYVMCRMKQNENNIFYIILYAYVNDLYAVFVSKPRFDEKRKVEFDTEVRYIAALDDRW